MKKNENGSFSRVFKRFGNDSDSDSDNNNKYRYIIYLFIDQTKTS